MIFVFQLCNPIEIHISLCVILISWIPTGYTCPALVGGPNSRVSEMVPKSQYYVGCGSGRAMFGPFSIYGEIAICKDGDYNIYVNGLPVNIKNKIPSCVSK